MLENSSGWRNKKDKYGNTVPGTEYFSVTTNQLGVELPTGEQQLTAGVGGFMPEFTTPLAIFNLRSKQRSEPKKAYLSLQ